MSKQDIRTFLNTLENASNRTSADSFGNEQQTLEAINKLVARVNFKHDKIEKDFHEQV